MSEHADLPKYRQCNPHGFFADDDTLYPEGSEFFWMGEPNEFMAPLNEPARTAMMEYQTKLDEFARKLADKMGRPFMGRAKDLAEQLAQVRADEEALLEKGMGKSKIRSAKSTQPNVQGHLGADGKPIKRRGRPPKITLTKMPEMAKPPTEQPIAILGKD